MYCVVRHCKSFWMPNSAIRFHRFPKNEERRRIWLSLVPLKGKFSARSSICSLHFKREHYDPDRPNHLLNTAVPSFLPAMCGCETPLSCHCISSSLQVRRPEDFVETTIVDHDYEVVEIEDGSEQDSKRNVCRVCLAADTKLYDMDNYNLKTLYEELTNCDLVADGMAHWLCWECASRLLSCERFRRKALRSRELLQQLHDRHDFMQQLRRIDREKHNLTSSLACKYYINHSDLHIHEETEEPTYNVEKYTNSDSHETILFKLLTEDATREPIQEININYIKNDNDHDNELLIEHITRKPIQEININNIKNDSDVNDDDNDIKDVHLDLDPKTCSDEASIKRKKPRRAKKKDESKIDRRRKAASLVLNETLFTITDLTFEEQVEELRRRKVTANYKNSTFKCDHCFKGFKDEDAYNSHIIRHTDQCGSFVCQVCKKHFKSKHMMSTHAAAHAQRFSCTRCPYVTQHRSAAKLHEDWHNGRRYQCPHCEENFDKFSTYMGHVRIKHPSDWVCALCGFSFVSGKGLSQHKKLKHRFQHLPIPEDGPYCEPCGVRFASQEALERHTQLSARHNYDKKDSECRKRTRRSASECERDGNTRRTRPHKPGGPIACEQCDLQLPNSMSYFRHFRRMHPGKNRTNYPSMRSKTMCEVCGKMFQGLALLQDHSFTHTDAKLFKCQLCDKTFQRKYGLIAHQQLHRGPRAAHACGTCGKRFTSASNRQRHMFRHTGLKPFKCEMCGKCFKYGSEKRAHITYVHLKKPWPKRARNRPDRQVQATQGTPQESEPLSPCDPKMETVDKPLYVYVL